ncbi:hypothetical protein MMM2322_00783 [Microbacterium sp. MM2322]
MPSATRISAPTAADQTIAASRALFPNGSAEVVISAAKRHDAQIAAYLAGARRVPLLYVAPDAIPASITTELARLKPRRILVVGSTASVDAAVARVLAKTAPVERISGGDTYALSRAVLRFQGPVDRVYVADGRTMDTAPIAAAAAAATGAGFMAVDGRGTASVATMDALRAVKAKGVVLMNVPSMMGSAFVDKIRSAGISVRRMAGSTSEAVAIATAADYPDTTTRAVVVSGAGIPHHESGTGAAVAGALRQPFLYARAECVSDAAAALLDRRRDTVLAVGPASRLHATVLSGDGCTAVRGAAAVTLRDKIAATMKRHPSSSYAVTVRQIGGLEVVSGLTGATRREPASMMKLFVTWAALTRVDKKQASLTTKLSSGLTVQECLRELIWMSDNYCHTDLVHWIGISNLNKQIAAAGYSQTSYGRVLKGQDVLYGGNRTTSNDLSLLLYRLEKGQLLSKASTGVMLTLMHTQLFRSRIPNGIPASAYQASKPGSLWVKGGLLQADSAIVRGPKGTFVLTVIGDAGSSKAGIRDIARTVYTHVNGTFTTAANHSDLHVRTTKNATWRKSAGGAVGGTIPKGTPLQVSDSKRHWYKLHYRGGYAWIWYSSVRSNLAY